jgi:DNA modification methylase
MINRRLWDRFRLPVNEIAKSKPWDLHYLGFDISPEYCEMARRRLAELEEPLERFIEG